MITRAAAALTIILLAGITVAACLPGGDSDGNGPERTDPALMRVRTDSLPAADSLTRYTTLTDEDFRRVANELQVEVPAIKAVVVIEAGAAMEGFWAPGVPVVNCDRSLWGKMAKKVVSKAKAPAGASIPPGLKSPFARKAWRKLINARKICIEQADLCTFWGMFQIGGFNYRLCGCASIGEFVRLMSYSELEQLELFAALITNTGQVKHLRSKNWSAFARAYNGPGYARRGYHTRMANAYRRFRAETQTPPPTHSINDNPNEDNRP